MEKKRSRGRAKNGAEASQKRTSGRRGGGARRQLVEIEQSRAWRLVGVLKHNPVYGLAARMRWGRNWREQLEGGSPRERLRKIQQSTSYRVIARTKRTWLYRTLRGTPDATIREVKPTRTPAQTPATITRKDTSGENGAVVGNAGAPPNGSLNGKVYNTNTRSAQMSNRR